MPSSHLILCRPLFLLPPISPSIRVFSNESALCKRWPKYWSFSLSISPSNEPQDWSPLGWTSWISLQTKGLARVFSRTTVQKHQFFSAQLSSKSNSHIHTWPLEKRCHHWLDGHEFKWTLGIHDGQGGMACCDSWGHKELDTTEWLNWTELKADSCWGFTENSKILYSSYPSIKN